MPQYGRRWWKGPAGVWDTLSVRDTTSPLVGERFTNTAYDVTGRERVVTGWRVDSTSGTADTTWTVAEREWTGNSSAVIAQRERPYKELFLILGWSTDRRASDFDISRGYYVGATLLTNALYPRDRRFSYVQLETDTRYYTPGLFSGHKVALRLRTTLRADSSDIYDGIYAGGETSIRGYPRGWFPRGFIANTQVLATAEYRFPIVATPPIDIPVFSTAVSGLKQFYYRLDGALIADGGYIWHRLEQPLAPHNHSYGTGFGAGLRVLAPTLERSGCFDFVWATDHEYNQLKKDFYHKQKAAGNRVMPYWIPDWYLYIDMMF
jgi:outer membrane protein assembly factor BamA